MTPELERKIVELEKRIMRLEEVCLSQNKSISSAKQAEGYHGLTGGINFLIDSGFLNSPKSSGQVHEELKREGYYHSLQSVDSALRQTFVSNKKILSRIKENGSWMYVMRK